MQNKTNSELAKIMEYSRDSAERQQAWERLLTQSPTNEDLRYIIEWTELKTQAWERLLTQSPTNEDLLFIIKNTPLKQEAAAALRERHGVFGTLDELGLIRAVADAVLERPGSLRMDKWHCGTSHCIGGHACLISEYARKIELATDTETAAHAMLPSYSHLFFIDDKTALAELQKIAAIK